MGYFQIYDQLLKLRGPNYALTETFELFLNQARTWFLEITFVPPKYVCMSVCLCVYVSTPEAISN